jgi:hypothetical protein
MQRLKRLFVTLDIVFVLGGGVLLATGYLISAAR